jgi:serine/threonine protein kinase
MSLHPQRHLINEIVHAASRLGGGERARYLSEQCSDPELRAEVERLLGTGLTTEVLRSDPGLSAGIPLGHYRIGKKLGAGGMGWVYEAVDEKLRRTVAIKVLPPGEISEDHRKRFAREAQSASALNHPNIVTVYEVGREGEVDYIVMERVDGETLHQIIGSKGLESRVALRYASQIADALASAHDAGIVHRDLKPGNVMVTERGLVKVLDFGLAKYSPRARAASGTDITAEPPVTSSGQVIGTLSYMSPEQAQGQPVDPRSDIFSFGSLLYEMVTGRRAFEDLGLATLSAILYADAPVTALPPQAPRGLGRILGKCVAKKPVDRWQHIADVKLQLDDLLKDVESPPVEEPAGTAARKRFSWPILLAACVAGGLVTAAVFRFAGGRAPVLPPEPELRMLTADTGLSSFPALSKDGKLFAFASDRSNEGNLDIWVQQIGGRDPIRLTKDPNDETDPAFSPDGTRIAFRSEKAGGGVYTVATFGGESPTLIAPRGRNPRFSPDGKWIAYWTGREGALFPGSARLFIMEAGGGQPRAIHPELTPSFAPAWSPRGNELLVLGQLRGVLDWYVAPLDAGRPVRKTGALAQLKAQGLTDPQIALNVRPAPLEWSLEAGERVLFAAPFGDAANLWEIDLAADGTVHGSARRITRGPGRQVRAARVITGDFERTTFSDEELNFDIWTFGLAGKSGEPRRLTNEHSLEWAPSLSSDGKTLAYITRRGGNWLLRTRDLESSEEATVISSPVHIGNGRLAGDRSRLIYSTLQLDMFSVPRSGGAVEKLCDACGTVMGVSHDGSKITFEPPENEDLLLFDSDTHTSRKLALRQNDGVILSGGKFSPDDQWVAFHSIQNSIGAARVWIAPVHSDRPSAQSEWIALTDGKARERDPSWAPDGSLVYFLSERDGFRCVWGRHVDARTKQPVQDAFPVRHFHSARQSLQRVGSFGYLTGFSVGRDQMVFALGELTGNVWLAETRRSN